MLVKHTLDFNGNLLNAEIIDKDKEPDLTGFINFHVDRLIELTRKRAEEGKASNERG